MTDDTPNRVRKTLDAATPVDDVPYGGQGDGDGPPAAPPSDVRDEDPHLPACALEPETDIGNGRRLLVRHEDRITYVANVGMHVFDGKRWAWDETDSLVRKLAHETAERIAEERRAMALLPYEQRIIDEADATADELRALRAIKQAEQTPEQAARQRELVLVELAAANVRDAFSKRKQSRMRHAKSSAGSSKLDSMVREAAPYITRKIEEMDSDPLAVNCQNGTLRFFETKSGKASIWDCRLDPHVREDLLTKCAAASYIETAECTVFMAFLDRMIPSDELRRFIQRYLGYCLTGLTHEQVFAFFHGGGRNGKSTLVDVVCRILDDYTTTVPIETLAGDQRRKGGDATPDLMRLPGARLVRASEPESTMKFREAMIKSLTSDEPILIRALHKDFNEIYPSFKLIISGNHKPRIDNDDTGMWRRVLLVPWEVQLPKDEIDKGLGKKLWAERNGIFLWLVQGALSYLSEGLNIPAEVLAATDEYRAESNPIGAFLDSCCDFTGDLRADRMAPGEVFNAYERMRLEQGWPQFKDSTFNKRLPDQATQRGAVRQKTGGLMTYLGMRLKPEFVQSYSPDPPSSGYGR